MKTFKLFILSIIVVCLASCGGKSSVKLKIEPQLGELQQYITISDDEVVVKIDNNDMVMASLRIQVMKPFIAENTIYLDVIVLDKTGNEIAELPNFEIEESKYDEYTNDGYKYYYYEGTLRAQMKDNIAKTDWQEICKQGVSIIVKTRSNNFKEYNNSSIYSAENDTIKEEPMLDGTDGNDVNYTSSSNDWDALIDSYEQLVDNYIYYAQKAINGDMDAIAKYPSFMQKAQEISSKMTEAQGQMSASQIKRYMDITAKLNKFASDLQ